MEIIDRLPPWSPARIYLNGKAGARGSDNFGITPALIRIVDAIDELAGEDGWVHISQHDLAEKVGRNSPLSEPIRHLIRTGLVECNSLAKIFAYRIPWMHMLQLLETATFPEPPDYGYWLNGAGTPILIRGEITDDEWPAVNEVIRGVSNGAVERPGWWDEVGKQLGFDPTMPF